MAPFQFKVKSYYNETGEFTEYFPAESATVIQFILQHWFNETLPNNLDIVAVKNDKGDQLVIDHVKRDIFDYYFIPGKARIYYHKKTDIQLMFFVLESFFNNLHEDLKENLTSTNDDWRFIRGDYLEKKFVYKITSLSIWKKTNLLVLQGCILLILSLLGFVFNPIILIFSGIYLAIFLVTSFFHTIALRQYYNDNADLEIRISRGNGQMDIKYNSWSTAIPKTDIRKIVKFVAPPDDARANAEFYTEIEFLNGDILNLTSLLISQTEIEGKFVHDLLPLEMEATRKGTLRRKTKMENYFSSIGPK